jgi:PAS domain S-box-containing protein
MPWIEELSDPQELRRSLRDLIALSALPGVWKTYDPQQIADSLAAALVSMLDAEFVYITLPGQRDQPVIEVTCTGERSAQSSVTARWALLARSPKRLLEHTAEIQDPLGEGNVRIAYAPIGLTADAVLIAGSRDPGFPTEAQRLILRMGANQAAIAVDRWRAETEERRFAALVERSSDFIGFASLDGVPQYINPAGLSLVGLDGIEEAGRARGLDFVLPVKDARARNEVWPIVMREGRWAGELIVRHFRTGAAIPFLVDWFRIDDPRTGQPMNIATVSRDLTAQKRAEAELRHLNETLERRVAERAAELAATSQELVREKVELERADARLQELQSELSHAARLSVAGQMAAALAHELNQPLTAATNFVNAARRDLARCDAHAIDAARQDMEDAVRQLLRAGQIIGRLRDFSSRGETERRIESVVTLVEEATAFALTGTGAHGVDVRFRFDPHASRTFADRIQIQQVLVNLIRNALEAMAESERRELVLTTARLEEAVEVAVGDSGPGLAKEIVDRLFEPFVSTKRNGMGLGLSICRSIVESHGGRIRVSENPGGGLTFRFTLPAASGNENDDGD